MNKIINQLEKVCRKKSEETYFSEHGKKKAVLWICGNILLSDGAKAICAECKVECFYDTKININFSKNHKKICLKCAYENHFNEFTALEQEIIKKSIGSKGNIK